MHIIRMGSIKRKIASTKKKIAPKKKKIAKKKTGLHLRRKRRHLREKWTTSHSAMPEHIKQKKLASKQRNIKML